MPRAGGERGRKGGVGESTPCSPRSKVALSLQDGLLPVINGVMGVLISRFITPVPIRRVPCQIVFC